MLIEIVGQETSQSPITADPAMLECPLLFNIFNILRKAIDRHLPTAEQPNERHCVRCRIETFGQIVDVVTVSLTAGAAPQLLPIVAARHRDL